MTDNKERVKKSFGENAANYVMSEIHAKGKDLTWIVEEVKKHVPQPHLALDIATGAGFTAFALSTCVGRVIGLDLTTEMLQVAQRQAEQFQCTNVTWMIGDAENISLPDQLFDVVTCRIAAHHFPHPEKAFQEVYRLLVPKGIFILIDNYAPADPSVEALLNRVETLRDPSHGHVYTLEKWSQLLGQAGFSKVEELKKWENHVDLDPWFRRMNTPAVEREKVFEALNQATKKQQQTLGYDPKSSSPQIILRKCMWLAQK
ncbi:class I SAM-dependent methyltransferase [Thermoflavimicrobium dichotomicum]|uniref:Ubiquinone/menaquinone biosynthesis C-methylase UbiE n=1 Tax=Thermoflavimicrobium dichotomicum TaxID=46223 RepID=A0A1I3V6N1_9BACL|nr:class I SAM-dependent methyltransferase [Thermoflavimicrobium dichotomicum]SFJ90623.1 Ubiquinone/menaquinone biosynthesis C-methylase UbiE [Thermoflavimicrobium dichotomicum]